MKSLFGGRFLFASAMTACIAIAPAARAGETIRYEASPQWVEQATLESGDIASQAQLRVLDRQIRIQDGTLWEYLDTAIHLRTPLELTQAGTITASWSPGHGDLIVHEVAIMRGDKVLDLVAQGSSFEVLRREVALERRVLDGVLTATMPVAGLQVGDILRLRYSITRTERALGSEVQSLNILPRDPDLQVAFGRVRASWEADDPVRMLAGPDVDLPATRTADGFEWLDLTLPVAEAQDVPADAPLRYRRPATLQLGTFANWAEVSSVMAPHYETMGLIAPGSQLADKVVAIKANQATDLARAVAALQLVQDEIGYLANGLNGGNYIPQTPAETWDLRYGDCKAKTLMLLAMLRDLGIEAEGLLVSSGMGDAVPTLLPMPAAFDHIIVRAQIDGHEYFLDGTGAGADLETVANVPDFRFGLPVRSEGASLLPIVQTLPRVAENDVALTIDMRAGLDLPALVTARFDVRGQMAAFLDSVGLNLTQDQRNDLAISLLNSVIGDSQIVEATLGEGTAPGSMVMETSAIIQQPFDTNGAEVRYGLPLPIQTFAFKPDRARRQWQDIPVDIGPPDRTDITYTILLPDGGEGFTWSGPTEISTTIAGQTLTRQAVIDDGTARVRESVDSAGGVISGDDIRVARRKAAALAGQKLYLESGADFTRRWRFADTQDRSDLAAIEAAFSRRIADAPTEAFRYSSRAYFFSGTFAFERALADLDKALELERSADLLERRSRIFADLLQRDKSRDDLREAYDLDPSPQRALALAHAMEETGDPEGAIDLLEQIGGGEDFELSASHAKAEFQAAAGKPGAGLSFYEDLLADKPSDPDLLNASCWFRGTWNVDVEAALPICSRAVESSPNPAAVLDSRALVFLRLGRLEEALADAEAALAINPEQVETELLRGLILREMGDSHGDDVIRTALARSPATGPYYARYGFDFSGL